MHISIFGLDSLLAVSPAALTAYARGAGWNREASYRVHSDVYIVAGPGRSGHADRTPDDAAAARRASSTREAARAFRERAPRPEVRLHGFVRLLKHGEAEDDGTIRLATDIDGQWQSVVAVLEQADYERAV